MIRWLPALVIALCLASSAHANGLDEMNQGGLAMRRGEFAAAVEHLGRAIESGELGPEYLAASRLSRGQALYLLGKYERTIEDCTAAMESGVMGQHHMGIAYGTRASAYRQLGKFDQAVADFDQAIALGVGGSKIYFHRGLAYEGKGDRQSAIADFTHAYKMEPDNPTYRDKMIELGLAVD